MGDLQWNLLNTNAPAQVAQAWDLGGAYQKGQTAALDEQIKRAQLNKLQVETEYAPMKLYAQQQKTLSGNALSAAKTEQTQLKTEVEKHKLRMLSADEVASASDSMIKSVALNKARQNMTLMGGDMQQLAQIEAHINSSDPVALRAEAMEQARDAKTKLAAFVAEGKLHQGDERLQQGWANVGLGAERNQIAKGNLAVNQQNANTNQQRMENTATPADQMPVSDPAIEAAANRYLLDGTLPALGIGKSGAAMKAAVLNRAAELGGERGIKPEEQRPLQINTAANKSALTQVSKQEAMVGAFEKNFLRNVDLAEKASEAVDRTGVPLVNKWINAGKRAIAGDVELSKLDIAIKAAVNEYTKIISGSMGNTVMAQSEIERVNNLLNAAQTKEQVKGVLDFMKQETKNRMEGFVGEKERIKGELQLPNRQQTMGSNSFESANTSVKTTKNGTKYRIIEVQ